VHLRVVKHCARVRAFLDDMVANMRLGVGNVDDGSCLLITQPVHSMVHKAISVILAVFTLPIVFTIMHFNSMCAMKGTILGYIHTIRVPWNV
jgi:hypothetical protein